MPVGLRSTLRSIGVTLGDGPDDLLVFLDRCRELIAQYTRVEARVAVTLWFDGPVERKQPRSDDAVHIVIVKRVIELEAPVAIASLV